MDDSYPLPAKFVLSGIKHIAAQSGDMGGLSTDHGCAPSAMIASALGGRLRCGTGIALKLQPIRQLRPTGQRFVVALCAQSHSLSRT
jgi:hypothetical protein